MQYHSSVELIETPALRERHLGSRQGKRAGVKRSMDESGTMEPREMCHARLRNWWNDTIIPLCISAPPASTTSASSNRQPSAISETQPLIVLAVSHSASIATLVLTILIRQEQYMSLVDLNSGGLYNTSITEVQFRVAKDETGEETVLPVISRFGDINHLLRPRVRHETKLNLERTSADLEEAKAGDEAGKKPLTGTTGRRGTSQ